MKVSLTGSNSSRITNADQKNSLTKQESDTKDRFDIIEDPQEDEFYTYNGSANLNDTDNRSNKSEEEEEEQEQEQEDDAKSDSGQQKMLLKYNFAEGDKNFLSGGSSTNKNNISKINKKKKGITLGALLCKNNLCYCTTLSKVTS